MPDNFGIRKQLCFCFKKRVAHIQSEVMKAEGNKPIQIKSLQKDFGKLKAVDNLSLDVDENEVVCLLGHNGAGKTTLINMLTGVLDPS